MDGTTIARDGAGERGLVRWVWQREQEIEHEYEVDGLARRYPNGGANGMDAKIGKAAAPVSVINGNGKE